MKCPYCGSEETKVIDSRESKQGTYIKRRRECINCEKRFSTAEKIIKLDLEVEKHDKTIEDFDITKIQKSIMKCLEKRPVKINDIEKILENTLDDIKQVESNTIPTSTIGTIVLRHLRPVDEIGFLKFALVHKNYESISDFKAEIDKLVARYEIEQTLIVENGRNETN